MNYIFSNLAFRIFSRVLICYMFLCISIELHAQNHTSIEADSIFKSAHQWRFKDTKKALAAYDQCLAYYLKLNDSAKIIEIMDAQISLNSGLAQYQKSYEIAWSLLPYVQSKNFTYEHVELLNKMTTLYMIYQQYEKARHTNDQAQKLITKYTFDEEEQDYLLGRLYSRKAWIVAEASKDYLQSEQLILKAIELHKRQEQHNIRSDYGELQLSELYLTMYRLKEALQILQRIEDRHKDSLKSIHCLIYEYMGRYYQQINQPPKAINYFKKAIFAIDSFEAHISNKVEILLNISQLYADLGNTKQAYKYLLQSKQLNDSVFSSTSDRNKELFEIKNEYESQLRKHEATLKNQKLTMLEQEKSLWLLKLIIIASIFVFIGGGVIFYYHRKAQNYALKQKLNKQKQDEILEIKNKQLLSSALQLIELDSQQKKIKKTLESLRLKDENKKVVEQLIRLLNTDNSKKWTEFEAHFTAINNDFLIGLKDKYPSLTATDLKICAFIKLGFSSKDMAQIMGIGVEGINTTRSRLRKKMNLRREVVLIDFLQSFGLE